MKITTIHLVCLVITTSSAQSVIVNEMSQGSSSAKEWAELLVITDNTDIRGWELGDNDDGTWHSLVTFTNHSDWSSVTQGTIIVIYNSGDVDGTITSAGGEDTNFSDKVVIIPSDNSTYVTDTGVWGGTSGAFSNSDDDDCAAIRDDSDNMIHDMAGAHPTADVPSPASGKVKYFTSNSVANVGNDSYWTQAASTSGTPGSGNGGDNSTWIDTSLPVELTSFTARQERGSNVLEWITESEIDNLGFLIDRSLEPNSGFTTIADYRFVPELQGQGSVTYRTDYSYTDREVVPGTRYYYVLSDVTGNPEHGEPVNRHTDKMVSATPKSQDISSALINGFKTFKAYPNPFNPKTVIAYELEDVRELSVSIVDVHGRQVTELYSGLQAQGFHEFTWQPKDISAGIYFCHLTSGGNTITRKLVLLK